MGREAVGWGFIASALGLQGGAPSSGPSDGMAGATWRHPCARLQKLPEGEAGLVRSKVGHGAGPRGQGARPQFAARDAAWVCHDVGIPADVDDGRPKRRRVEKKRMETTR